MTIKQQVYFDDAATSWPKAPLVAQRMYDVVHTLSGSPGRGSHRHALESGRVLLECRIELARLFHINDPNHIAFMLNTTMAIHVALHGLLKPGDHVITTQVEHNSIRRPLELLARSRGIQVSYALCNEYGEVSLDAIVELQQSNTKLVVMAHGTNVFGSIQPIQQIGQWTRKQGITFLVDAAQTAGVVPIDAELMHIDLLAFPGHKGLLGPQGTGGLYVHPSVKLEPVIVGGSGGNSESVTHPTTRPDLLEAGTLNTPGIAGLLEGAKFIRAQSVDTIYKQKSMYIQIMLERLMKISDLVHIIGPPLGQPRLPLISFYIEGIDSHRISFLLDREFGIAVRSGLHCAPLAHERAGTLEQGLVRASIGLFNTLDEINYFEESVRTIINRERVKQSHGNR